MFKKKIEIKKKYLLLINLFKYFYYIYNNNLFLNTLYYIYNVH